MISKILCIKTWTLIEIIFLLIYSEIENYNKLNNYIDIQKSSFSNTFSNKIIIFETDKKIILIADDNQVINICSKKIITEILKEAEITDVYIICVNDGIDILKLNLKNEDTEKYVLW